MKFRAFVSTGDFRRELYRGAGGGRAIQFARAAAEALVLFKLSGRVYVEEYPKGQTYEDPQTGHPLIIWAASYEYGKPVTAIV
jgi:hypothetical protein